MSSKVDPFTVGLTQDNREKFCKLGFYEQLDACMYAASLPDVTGRILTGWIYGAICFSLNCIVVLGLTYYFTNPEENFYVTLLKNVIAYHNILCHNGFETHDRVFDKKCLFSESFKVKYIWGSIKEPLCPSILGSRRTYIDIVVHLLLVASRIWMIVSPSPTALCGWCYFVSVSLVYILDFGEYCGMKGYYHGPWSVFMLAWCIGEPGAISVMQWLMLLLYIGCGLGKMGPWFASVFAQEHTLPPWATKIKLKGIFYGKDFPKDNTVSTCGVALAYAAASSEWIAPLLLLLPASVIGGSTGSCSWPVAIGIFTIVAMHLWIMIHIPARDVWALNLVPAFIVYHVFYQSPYLSEPGFDFAGFCSLSFPFQAFCWFMLAYCIYGQLSPGKMSYMNCYRFWAGNWPQSMVFISESGLKKMDTHVPYLQDVGMPGREWEANMFYFGIMQMSQPCHRVMPMLIHKAMKWGAKQRGELKTPTLAEFILEQNGNFFTRNNLSNSLSGYTGNDALRSHHCVQELQKMCRFEKGELLLCQADSFQVFAHLWNGESNWYIIDAADGLVEEGTITVKEALAIVKPSVLAGYEKRSDRPLANGDYQLLGA